MKDETQANNKKSNEPVALIRKFCFVSYCKVNLKNNVENKFEAN
jgi:hypothetical protein